MLLINTFSPLMVRGSFTSHWEELSKKAACNYLRANGFTSAISSREVAYLFGSVLQLLLSVGNINISMTHGDQAIIGLYKGPKIRSKQSKLLNGAYISWYLLTID